MDQGVRIVLRFISVVMLAFSAGCSDEILATEFDQSCAADSDCAAVLVGDMCSCSCVSGAINKGSLAEYNERRADISCSIDCSPCPALEPAVCKSGVCSVE